MAKAPIKPVVVLHGTGDDRGRPLRVLGAMAFSFTVNGIVMGALLAGGTYFNLFSPSVTATDTIAVIDGVIDEEQPEPNLVNPDSGLNANNPTTYDLKNVGELSVPGLDNPDDMVGLPTGSPEIAPSTLPVPPGAPGRDKTGGGPDVSIVGDGPGWKKDGNGRIGPKAPAFQGRVGQTRMRLLQEEGGNAFSEAAVARGLAFLAAHQGTDGRWSLHQFHIHGKCNCTGVGRTDNDVAATALVLLSLLGAGETHKGGKLYSKQVERGLRYLTLVKQNPRTGEFHSNMYSHALATMAVCEAYGLTSDATLRGPAQRSLNYIVEAQSDMGGWRYGARQPGYDTSVSGWQLMALKSGQMAGLNVPVRNLNLCKKWLDHAAQPDGGGYGYVANTPADATPAEKITLTSVGLLSRQYLGWGPRNPGLIAGVRRLQQQGPRLDNMYYTYYASQVMHHFGGDAWKDWNAKLRDSLIAAQDQGLTGHEHQKGSWYNGSDGISGGYGGRIMCTALSVLTLEVYYRHLPLYRRDVATNKGILEGN